MPQNYTYDVFVSHNHHQKDWVRSFVKVLRTLGIQTFFDEDDIDFGKDITTEVMRGLENSKQLIFIVSPESVKSRWVAAECLSKLYQDPDGQEQGIIPIILNKVDANQIPLFIRGKQHADLTDETHKITVWERLLRQLGATAQILPDIPDSSPIHQKKDASQYEASIKETPIALQRHFTIVGMGYVGTLLAAALANAGHTVLGIEDNKSKLDRLSSGDSHLLEPGIDELLRKAHLSGKLTVTRYLDADQTSTTDFVVVCVGPYLRSDGNKTIWETSRLRRILEEVGETIRKRKSLNPLNLIIAATVRAQDCEKKLVETYLNRQEGNGFLFATSPLFSREGSMVEDLQNPPFIVTGTFDGLQNKASREWSDALLNLVDANRKEACQVLCMTTGVAAMVKLTSNAFHAVKVCFANEVGRICNERGINSQKVMEFFARDTILNISDLYLRAGFAFGGSCLGKDIFGLLATAEKSSLETFRLLRSIQPSNNEHIKRAAQLVKDRAEETEQKTIGFFGLTFKTGTDDIRSSPAIELINQLPRQYEIFAIDFDLAKTPDLTGNNRSQWIDVIKNSKITLANSVEELVSNANILVITKSSTIKIEELLPLLSNKHSIIDLTGELTSIRSSGVSTFGIV